MDTDMFVADSSLIPDGEKPVKMSILLKVMICHVGAFLYVLGYAGLICESSAQGLPSDALSETSRAFHSKKLEKLVPYAGYEERLRQSPQWQTLTPEEQAEAIDKIVLARKQFLERQQQLQKQYEDTIKKRGMLKEIITGKWTTREHQSESKTLWGRYQNLPVRKRLHLERQLGLGNVRSSQRQKKFQERMDGLSYSKRNHILRQLQ